MSNRETPAREIGILGEKIAVSYLRRHGYTVKERNYRAGHWEIDIIAASWHCLAFAEVKTRTYEAGTSEIAKPPRAAVDAEKQRLTRAAAKQYLAEHPTRKQPRMDVIEIFLEKPEQEGKRPKVLKIHHLKGAY